MIIISISAQLSSKKETIAIDVTIVKATFKYIKSHDKAEDAANQAADIQMKIVNS